METQLPTTMYASFTLGQIHHLIKRLTLILTILTTATAWCQVTIHGSVIVSTDLNYKETQYNEPTKDRKILLPKAGKGKEKKLTGSVLESRQANGRDYFNQVISDPAQMPKNGDFEPVL